MPLKVLIIEDNAIDAMLLQQALANEAVCTCTVIDHGDQAADFLQALASGSAAAIPELILLDLNLPGTDGVEMLTIVRNSPKLMHVPVAVVSSSPKEFLVTRAADADCYVTKPANLEEYLAIGRELLDCVRREKGARQARS